jgi:hypothetical protein
MVPGVSFKSCARHHAEAAQRDQPMNICPGRGMSSICLPPPFMTRLLAAVVLLFW